MVYLSIRVFFHIFHQSLMVFRVQVFCLLVCVMCVLVTQLCPTLSNPMDCIPPHSSVHGILQARNTGVGSDSLLQESSPPRNQAQVSLIAGLLRKFYSYFIIFDVTNEIVVNGIVTWISISDLSLLVYRNATDIFVLILWPETLPNPLSSSSFLALSIGSSMYLQTVSSANSWQLNLFSSLYSLYFFFFSDCHGYDSKAMLKWWE